jgi:hypothetical protein
MPSEGLRKHLAGHARDNSFMLMLIGTILLLLVFPFLHGTFLLRLARGFLILALFFPTVYAHGRHTGRLILTATLFTVSLGTFVWELATWSKQAEAWHSAANTCYFFVLAYILIRYVAAQDAVSRNVVSATLVVYVMLAFAWTFLYDFVETLQPGSFTRATIPGGEPNQRVVFFYFSMITITTVGFGDVVPVSPMARMLTTTEALVGQLYLVAAVALVVGLRATTLAEQRRARRQEKE